MRGEEQHPIPDSFLGYSTRSLSNPSAVELRANPHKSTLAGKKKAVSSLQVGESTVEWRLLADCWIPVAACLAFEQTHKWKVNSSSGFIR